MTGSSLSAPELDAAVSLLDPGPQPIETGVQRLASGQLHVAARTDMPRCKGAMFEWWFRFAPDTRQYAWWHPLDHVSSEWAETNPRTHIGSTHIVQERLNGSEVQDLQIHFIDPREIFGVEAFDDALARGDISAVVAAQLGMGPTPLRDDRGRPNMGRMTHICRDTPEGMVLRSRFWLGAGTGAPAEQLAAMVVPDAVGLDLMVHAHTEFKYLARFLPSLYIAENRDSEGSPSIW